jgi:hypothetical protein
MYLFVLRQTGDSDGRSCDGRSSVLVLLAMSLPSVFLITLLRPEEPLP